MRAVIHSVGYVSRCRHHPSELAEDSTLRHYHAVSYVCLPNMCFGSVGGDGTMVVGVFVHATLAGRLAILAYMGESTATDPSIYYNNRYKAGFRLLPKWPS